MGNYLTNFENDMGISMLNKSAPEANYTISPAVSNFINQQKEEDQNKDNNTSDEKCNNDINVDTEIKTTTVTNMIEPVPFGGSSNNNTYSNIKDELFNSTTFSITFWIFVMYIVYKTGSSIFRPRDSNVASIAQMSYSRTIDIILGICVILYLVNWYNTIQASEQDNILGYSVSWLQEVLDDPWSLFALIWFTIIFFTLIYILRVPMATGAEPVLIHFIENKIWLLYAVFAVIYFFKYFLGIPIVSLLFNNNAMNYLKTAQPSTSSIYDTLSSKLAIQPITTTTTTTTKNTSIDNSTTCDNSSGSSKQSYYDNATSSPSEFSNENNKKQVFNVSNNLYTYEEAQEVCRVFDSTLATYDQIESSYQNGGEWCNYGWSDGQMAYFPTQKATWTKLQQNPKTKHSCGRPGINGGFINNPYVKFGVNCYGNKPTKPDDWIPPTYEQPYDLINTEIKEDNTAKLRAMIDLNSFNLNQWSRY